MFCGFPTSHCTLTSSCNVKSVCACVCVSQRTLSGVFMGDRECMLWPLFLLRWQAMQVFAPCLGIAKYSYPDKSYQAILFSRIDRNAGNAGLRVRIEKIEGFVSLLFFFFQFFSLFVG